MAFLGLFGNYDKPGPGVDKDEPKKAAPVRFFEILWRKLSKLVQLNLTFMIPFIVVIALMVGVFLLPIPHFLYATSFFGVLDLYILYAVTLPLILLSPFTCGLAYVTVSYTHLDVYKRQDDHIRHTCGNGRFHSPALFYDAFICFTGGAGRGRKRGHVEPRVVFKER